MKKSYRIRTFISFIILLSCLCACSDPLLFLSPHQLNEAQQQTSVSNDGRKQRNFHILLRYPHYFKGDGRPKATVGVVLYTYDQQGEAYILLAREGRHAKDLKVEGSYAELSGSAEGSKEKVESFLDGCLRECREESAGLYDFTPHEALENALTYFSDSPQRQVVEIFLEVDTPYTTEDLLKAQKNFHEPSYHEKNDFKWVRLKDLLQTCERKKEIVIVKGIHGRSIFLRLRSYFLNLMNDGQFRRILTIIANKSQFKSRVQSSIEH